ncbi:hypothetical protein ILYODFUR_035006, partial [Ilyodon furcidens]
VVCVVHNFKGKLLLDEESPAEQQPNTAMLNMGQVESPLEKYIASQETDDEDEESCFIKECLQAFLRWLHGLNWFEHLRNKRQTSFEVVWKMNSDKSLEITAHLFLFYYFLLLVFHSAGWHCGVCRV